MDLDHVPKMTLKARTAPTTYSFRSDPPVGGWALATVNDETGELSIQSDWGSWSYRWHVDHLGPGRGVAKATLTEFLSGRSSDSCHYIADKLTSSAHSHRWAFDPEATVAYLKERVADKTHWSDASRAEMCEKLDDLPLDGDSRDFVDAFYDIEDHDDAIVHDGPGEWLKYENTSGYLVLLHRIIPALVEACNETMAQRYAVGGDGACRPRVHAILTEHEMICQRCGTAGARSDMSLDTFLTAHRDCPVAGGSPTWTYSTNKEHWYVMSRFWSRDQAVADVDLGTAAELDVEAGGTFFTGRIEPITAADAARGTPDAARILEYIDEHLYENYGVEDGCNTPPQAAQTQLDEEIRGLVARWLDRTGAVPSWYRIVDVQSHVYAPAPAPHATPEQVQP